MEKPAPTFPKRNATRVVVRNRNRNNPRQPVVTVTSSTSTVSPATIVQRKTVRRKITRIPTTSTLRTTTTPPTTTTFATKLPEFVNSNEFDDDVASVLPAITSAQPRRRPHETSTKSFQLAPLIEYEVIRQVDPPKFASQATPQAEQLNFNKQVISQPDSNSYEKILEHQYKIKGIDISEEETYEDEKLIGVLGSEVNQKLLTDIKNITQDISNPQVKVVLHSFSNDPKSIQVECLDVGYFPHPTDCAKYIQCARSRGFIQGQIHECGAGLSFQVGGTCAVTKGCTRNNVRLMSH